MIEPVFLSPCDRVEKGDSRKRRQKAKEGSESLSNSRDTIEDHVFEL